MTQSPHWPKIISYFHTGQDIWRRWSQKPALRILIVAVMAIWFWKIVPWGMVVHSWAQVGVPAATLGLGAVLLSALLEIVSWGVWLPAKGAGRWFRLLRYYASGIFLNQFIPSGTASDVWRWTRVSGEHGSRRAFTSLAMARVLMFAGLVLWLVVAVGVIPGELRQPTIFSAGIALAVLSFGALLLTISCAALPLHQRAIGLLSKWSDKVMDGGILKSRRRWVISLAAAAASWGAMIFAVTVFGGAMGMHLPWSIAAIGLIASLALSWVPWTPNGIGWRDGAFTIVMLHAGMTLGSAIALSVFIDFSTLPLALLGGFVLMTGRRRVQANA